jgi:nitrogen fixation NifU-like protein
MERNEETIGFDRLVEKIQREIDEQERSLYSAKVIEEAHHPKNVGRMRQADVCGLVHGWCGDTMEVFLRLDGEMIREAKFVTDGCGPTLACGSMLTSMLRGLSLTQADEIMPEHIIAALDGLPEESQHCAELAVSTLQNALFNWRLGSQK